MSCKINELHGENMSRTETFFLLPTNENSQSLKGINYWNLMKIKFTIWSVIYN